MGTTPTEPNFRLSFYGYDRQDVDAYVRTLTGERNELRHRVDELESTLDATAEYLQSRRGRQTPMSGTSQADQDPRADDAKGSVLPLEPGPNRRRRFALGSAWGIVLLTLLFASSAYWHGRTVLARSGPNQAVAVPATVEPVSNSPRSDMEVRPDTMPAPRPTASTDPQPDGLIVSLATATECWIGIAIDGERHIERLLQHDEQFSVHARSDLLLRVGNAGAVSFRINGRAAKQLGPAGQPATARITSANFEQFLAQADSP